MSEDRGASRAEKSLFLPKASVRRIMKLNEEVGNISNDAALATCMATEVFLSRLIESSQKYSQSHKRKTIKVDDIIEAIDKNPKEYAFLQGAFGNLDGSGDNEASKSETPGPVQMQVNGEANQSSS